MFITTAVLSGVFALFLLFSAYGKLTRDPRQMATMATVGFPPERIQLLAAAEIAAAAGLVAGLFWWPIGVAAGIGITLYFLGAVLAHVRVKDYKNVPPPVVMLVVSVAVLVLRLVTV